MHARLLVEEAEGINTRTTSPDGRYVWIANPVEARMSLWIVEGELWLKEPATLLFAPPTSWSFEERAWTSPSTL
ncbi:MAG: hypothetical protein IPK60_10415 [Sandaracinaceae bacterium]|nr:hypothetical protein [Sandaracinaceae bacterium]